MSDNNGGAAFEFEDYLKMLEPDDLSIASNLCRQLYTAGRIVEEATGGCSEVLVARVFDELLKRSEL